jgi:hypothetical protein
MSKRAEWLFGYTCADVARAARARQEHHAERLAFWTEQAAQAEGRLRTSGLEFRDVPVSGGTRLDPVLDPQLQLRLSECKGKLAEHRSAEDAYARWGRILDVAPERVLELAIADVEYFGL